MSQSIQRAIDLIRLTAQRPVSLTEAADEIGVHKSTALRILQTLESARFVRRTGAGTYVFGSGLIELSERTLGSIDLRQQAAPILRELQRRVGHTVHLAQLTGDEIIYVDKVDSGLNAAITLPSRVGNAVSLYASAVGKAILAHLPRSDRDRLLQHVEYVPFTATTMTDRDSLEIELTHVRQRGWAVDDGELESYIRCVAVPVRDSRGDVKAAMSITAIDAVASLDTLKEHLPLLNGASRAISAELGYTGGPSR